jgi:ubiquinone/menaquinone biosynthesis C-methylase UbiE
MSSVLSHGSHDISSPSTEDLTAAHAEVGKLILAYRNANILFSANALGLFEAAEGGRTAAEIAQCIHADIRATEILLDALCALGWLQKANQRYDNTPLGRETFLPTGTHYLGNNCLYQELTGKSWADLCQVVKSGRSRYTYGDIIKHHPRFLRSYIYGMDEIARQPAQQLAAQLDLSTTQSMLDVGGGPGTFSRTLLEHAPQLRGTLLDLPETIALNRAFFAAWPHHDRMTLQIGDYHTTSFGDEQYDLVLLSHITHNEGEQENLALLAKTYRTLRPGGQVVIHDFMVEDDRTHPLFSALFSVHMLVLTERGKVYRRKEYETWLLEVGFRALRVLHLCPGAVNASMAIVAVKEQPGTSVTIEL